MTSPFTPAVVVVAARRRSIAVSLSLPWISSFESTGCSDHRPPGLGAIEDVDTDRPVQS